MATKVGMKYVCPVCHSEFIVTKSGNATLNCCGKEMEQKQR